MNVNVDCDFLKYVIFLYLVKCIVGVGCCSFYLSFEKVF